MVSRSSSLEQRQLFYNDSRNVIDHFLNNNETMASQTSIHNLRNTYRLLPQQLMELCPVYEGICSSVAIRRQQWAIYSLCNLIIIFKILCE